LPAFTIYVNGGAASGYSDVPLAYCFTVFAVSLFKWVSEGRRSDFVIALFFAIFALFTKMKVAVGWNYPLLYYFFQDQWLQRPVEPLGQASYLYVRYWLWRPGIITGVTAQIERITSLADAAPIAAGWRDSLTSALLFLRVFLKPHLWSLLGVCLAFVFCFSPARALRGPHSIFLWIAFFYGIFIVLIYIVTPGKWNR
jgi:hypothetical protein